jgi:hypothetical protein
MFAFTDFFILSLQTMFAYCVCALQQDIGAEQSSAEPGTVEQGIGAEQSSAEPGTTVEDDTLYEEGEAEPEPEIDVLRVLRGEGMTNAH